MEYKSLIYSTLALGDPRPVNMSLVYTFIKAEGSDYTAKKNSKNGKFQIQFMRTENFLGPKDIVWEYETEEERNCEYNILLECYTNKISK